MVLVLFIDCSWNTFVTAASTFTSKPSLEPLSAKKDAVRFTLGE